MSIGQKVGGKDSFCTSAKYFFGEANYKMTLDLLALIMEHPPWRPELDYMYDVCTSKLPSYFPREKAIRFALSRQKWNEITIADLTTLSTASLILPFREQNELKTMIASCTNSERTQIEHSLPTVVGDYYLERKDYTYAVDLYLEGSDVTMAMGATDSLLDLPQSKTRTSKLVQIVALWNKPNNKRAHKNVSRDSHGTYGVN